MVLLLFASAKPHTIPGFDCPTGVYNFMQSLQRYNNLTPMPRLSDTHTEYEADSLMDTANSVAAGTATATAAAAADAVGGSGSRQL